MGGKKARRQNCQAGQCTAVPPNHSGEAAKLRAPTKRQLIAMLQP